MTNNMDVLNLVAVLNSEIKVYRNLLDIILAEYEILVANDYDAIHSQLNAKNKIYTEITELEKNRMQIISNLAIVNKAEIQSVSDVITFVSDEKIKVDLALCRDVLRMLVSRITEANKANSDFVEHSRKLFHSVVGNLKDLVIKKDKTGVYSNKGTIDDSRNQKGTLLINKGV